MSGWSCRECGKANPDGTAYCGHCGARWGSMRSDDLRMVTALFADISGFTTLADTLEVEELHDIINPLIAGLAQIAERYEGFISKYAGDALLVLFGAPVAHEDDAQRALLAALVARGAARAARVDRPAGEPADHPRRREHRQGRGRARGLGALG